MKGWRGPAALGLVAVASIVVVVVALGAAQTQEELNETEARAVEAVQQPGTVMHFIERITDAETGGPVEARHVYLDARHERSRVETYLDGTLVSVRLITGNTVTDCCERGIVDQYPAEASARLAPAYQSAVYLEAMARGHASETRMEANRQILLTYESSTQYGDEEGNVGTCTQRDTVRLDSETALPVQVEHQERCEDGRARSLDITYEKAEQVDAATLHSDFWAPGDLPAFFLQAQLDSIADLGRDVLWLPPSQDLEPFIVAVRPEGGGVAIDYRPPGSRQTHALVTVTHWPSDPPKLCGSSANQLELTADGRPALLCDGLSDSLFLWRADGSVVELYATGVLDKGAVDSNVFNTPDALIGLASDLVPLSE